MAEEGGSVGGSTLEGEVEGLGGCWKRKEGLREGSREVWGSGSRMGGRLEGEPKRCGGLLEISRTKISVNRVDLSEIFGV
jgi:hypothetical protein